MSKNLTVYVTALTLLVTLAIPVQLAAQEQQEQKKEYRRYMLIDIAAFGGPTFLMWIIGNLISLTGGFMNSPAINSQNAWKNWVIAVCLLATLFTPARLHGQQVQEKAAHHHYKLIDVGTFDPLILWIW